MILKTVEKKIVKLAQLWQHLRCTSTLVKINYRFQKESRQEISVGISIPFKK